MLVVAPVPDGFADPIRTLISSGSTIRVVPSGSDATDPAAEAPGNAAVLFERGVTGAPTPERAASLGCGVSAPIPSQALSQGPVCTPGTPLKLTPASAMRPSRAIAPAGMA